jgi:hypothetical protein
MALLPNLRTSDLGSEVKQLPLLPMGMPRLRSESRHCLLVMGRSLVERLLGRVQSLER